MSGIVHQPLDGCATRINITSLMKLNSSLVVFSVYGPQNVVHFGWALTVDCCPVMSSIKFTLLSTSAKGNICGMVLPKFWIKHSRQYFGSQAGLVQNCGSCCNGKEL